MDEKNRWKKKMAENLAFLLLDTEEA